MFISQSPSAAQALVLAGMGQALLVLVELIFPERLKVEAESSIRWLSAPARVFVLFLQSSLPLFAESRGRQVCPRIPPAAHTLQVDLIEAGQVVVS
jgi:hypothetical protein